MADEKTCLQCHDKNQVSVPFFVHENALMHKDMDNERLHETLKTVSTNNHRTVCAVCAAFVLIIVIFVTAYTVRTSIWLDTIAKMNNVISEMATGRTSTGAEVADAIHEQSD